MTIKFHTRLYNSLLVFLFIAAFCPAQLTFAQNQEINSLLNKAETLYKQNPKAGLTAAKLAYAKSIKGNLILQEIKSLHLLVSFYGKLHDYPNMSIYGQTSLQVAQQYGVDSLIGDSWMLNGVIDHLKNNYASAIAKYQKSLIYYTKSKLLKRIASTYHNLGFCEMKLSRFERANVFNFKAADIFEKLRDNKNLSNIYNSIGLCFLSLKNHKKAIEYQQKALGLRIALGDKPLVSQSYNNLGYAYKEKKMPDSAISYLKKCLDLRKLEKDSSKLVLTLQNLGSAYQQKNELAKAERYIGRSLKIAANYGMKEELAQGRLDLAEVYFAQKQYTLSEIIVTQTEQTAKELATPELLMSAYAFKTTLYEQMRDYKNALLYERKKEQLEDSLFSIAQNRTINDLEVKYQTEQKIKDIETLNAANKLQKKVVSQQKTSIVILLLAAALLIALLILAYSRYRLKNEANQRIQSLMKELHHRVKNNLQILAGLFTLQVGELKDETAKNTMRENESRILAMNLVHQNLYKGNFDTQVEMQVYLKKLLDNIKFSFGTETTELIVDAESIQLEADKAVSIGFIVNELATNAFKYAFANRDDGLLQVTLKVTGKSRLRLILKDNGKGMNPNQPKPSDSFGLKLVDLMAKQLNSNMEVQYNGGTSYIVDIAI